MEEKVYFDLERVPLRSEREEKRNRRKKRFLIFLLCLLCFLCGTIGGAFLFKAQHTSYQADVKNTMGEIEYLMDHYWLYSDEYDDLTGELENKALYGMTDFDYDPYTSYMSKEELDMFSESINMDYVGIGVEYSYYDSIAIVKKVFKNSPAEKAGVMAGDIIKEIDGESIEGFTSDDIRERVLGTAGTEVVITFLRGGESIDIPIIRGAVNNTVYAYRENDYVVMELNSFGNDTGTECMRYLDEYTDLDKIIIDLRNDSGGYQSSVKELCGLFIGNNEVYLRQKGIDGTETADTTYAKKTYDNFKKIVLLVNENTASAAEVFTICLKECHKDVSVVGVTTYGKGVIQTTRLLNNGGALKVTTYYWYSPNGTSIHGTGIVPDVEVRMPEIYYQVYYFPAEGETYEPDSVSETVKLVQQSLEFLDYPVDRTDGYFDQSMADCLREYKVSKGLSDDPVLDAETFEAIVSDVSREIATNPDKDLQMIQAKELINGNQD
ncbi:MAG: PDZ domain-containing protein [Erysipelotrichaceae bacterium]|nr:PDZ domain-containing protein [Erysipelotrichaceae bacterium]